MPKTVYFVFIAVLKDGYFFEELGLKYYVPINGHDYNEMEAYYVCGIINSKNIRDVIDGYAIDTNRGIDVLKYIAIPKYDQNNELHLKIATISKEIHQKAKENSDYYTLEKKLIECVYSLFAK